MQILVFRLGEELYGLEVEKIQEVVESPILHYIPRASKHLLGAVNFHGNILPVLDLAAFLGFFHEQRDRRIIILATGLCSLALAVTAVGRIVTCDADALLPLQQEQQPGCHIRAVLSREEEMINMLDAARLLTSLEKT
jgi:purine-binding chemotaxis protein CheW